MGLAATDLGNGACFDEGAQAEGLWNGTTADDAGCVTEAEYQLMYGTPEIGDALMIVVSVDPALEPDAPTVREVFQDPFVRAELAGFVIE